MLELLKVLLVGILDEGVGFISQFLSTALVETVMYAEHSISAGVAGADFSRIFDVMYQFGMALVIFKFIKKGADIYLIGSDGDATNEPSKLLIGLLKAMIVIITFPTLYGWLVHGVTTLTNDLLGALAFEANLSTIAVTLMSAGVFLLIIILVFLILYCILFVQFIMRGIEMLVLRAGLPIAAVGLMDADGGVFTSYIKKFLQSSLTVIVQLALAKLSVALMVSVDPFWALGTVLMAIKTPRFLSDFMLTANGVNFYQTMQMGRIVKGVFKR